MTKQTIIFLSSKNPALSKEWSGIPFYLFKALSVVYEVEYISLPTFTNVRRLGYYLSKLLFFITRRKYVFDYGLFLALLYGFWGTMKLRGRRNYEFVFSPAGLTETSFLRTSLPIVSYGDCSTLQLINYYPSLANVSKLSEWEIKFVEQQAFNKTALSIFSSEWASRFVEKQFGKQCHTIPFGANIADEQQVTSLKEMSGQSCNLLFIGVDWIRKGGEVAFNVHQKLLDKGIKSTLTIVGTTPPTNLKLPSSVEVVSHLSKDKASDINRFKEIFNRSHLLLLPTLADCTPIVLAEAYANAIPVLASNTGGLPTMVVDGETGYLLEIGDVAGYVEKIGLLINDKNLYTNISQNCLSYYSNRFNWGIFAIKLNQLANSLSPL